MRLATLSVLAVLSLIVSACVQAPEEALETPAAGEGGATLLGVVVSEEVFPVRGANVSIADGPSTLTDEEGRFSFTGLEPGRVTVIVSAVGYEPAEQEVSLSAGSTLEITFELTGVAGEAPYLTTIIYEGYLACSMSAVYSAQQVPWFTDCPFGDSKTGTSVNATEDWRAGVHEMAWETSEEMIFASSLADSCITGAEGPDPCPHLSWGPSPIQAFARIEDSEYAAQYALDGEATWPEGEHTSHIFAGYSGFFRSEINETAYPACVVINNQFNIPEHWGCPFGVGYTTGLRFTMYHTTFYLEEPPALEQFTAIPDQ